MYQITIKREALKELQLLPKNAVSNISASIDALSDNPRPVGCKKLKGGAENLWRIRIGDYRVIYSIDDVVLIVGIRRIGHRKNIYE